MRTEIISETIGEQRPWRFGQNWRVTYDDLGNEVDREPMSPWQQLTEFNPVFSGLRIDRHTGVAHMPGAECSTAKIEFNPCSKCRAILEKRK